jgi:hypothetical protein
MNEEACRYLVKCNVNELISDLKKDRALNDKVKSFSKLINRNSNQDCEIYISNLSIDELIRLIIAYTIIETYYWSINSVPTVPTLLDALKERSYAQFIRLVDLVITITDGNHPYIPFDNLRYAECRSYGDYLELIAKNEISAIKLGLDKKFRQLEKFERIRLEANINIWDAILRRDTEAIKVLVKDGVDFKLKNKEGVTVSEMLQSINIHLTNETS